MWIRVTEKELRELFDGLSRLNGRGTMPEDIASGEHPLVAAVRQAVREECAALMREHSAQPPDGAGMREALLRYTERPVELSTPGGTVLGTITEVGGDYTVVTEAGGTQVVVALTHIIGLEPIQGV